MKMSKKIQELEQEIACNKWWIDYFKNELRQPPLGDNLPERNE